MTNDDIARAEADALRRFTETLDDAETYAEAVRVAFHDLAASAPAPEPVSDSPASVSSDGPEQP